MTNKGKEMGKRRAPGGGRKPKGEFSGVTSPLSIRMPEEMRRQLEAAAHARGRSVSQETLRRIQETFRSDRERARDPAMQALCFLIAQLAGGVAGLTDPQGRPAFDWRSDRFFFRAFKLAVAKVLDALEPSGEIRPPTVMLDNFDKDEQGLRLLEMVRATYETPEARADSAARTLMSSLVQPSFDAQHFDEVAPNHKSKGLREHYGFVDARNALQIKSKVDKS
jgi:Arc-like DNA binding domain